MVQLLHDEVLRTIHVDWEKGVVILDFDGGAVTCSGLTQLRVSREQPWGGDQYMRFVKHLEWSDEIDAGVRVVRVNVLMQAGDEIGILASGIEASGGSL